MARSQGPLRVEVQKQRFPYTNIPWISRFLPSLMMSNWDCLRYPHCSWASYRIPFDALLLDRTRGTKERYSKGHAHVNSPQVLARVFDSTKHLGATDMGMTFRVTTFDTPGLAQQESIEKIPRRSPQGPSAMAVSKAIPIRHWQRGKNSNAQGRLV